MPEPPSEIIVVDGCLYHLGIAPGEIAPSIFLVGDPARARKVAAHFDSIEHEVGHREYVTLTGHFRDRRLSVIGTGIGTDNVEIALIEAHAALTLDPATLRPLADPPVADLIRIGTSGGIDDEVSPGTLCIAEYALGLDSTGPFNDSPAADDTVRRIEVEAQRLLERSVDPGARFHGRILPYGSKAHAAVFGALRRQAERRGTPHATGITVSTPGFYAASSRRIAGLANTVPDIKGMLAGLVVDGRRVLNMEMESSLLFHLAGALGHRAGTVCVSISQRHSSASLLDYDAAVEDAIELALAAMIELTE